MATISTVPNDSGTDVFATGQTTFRVQFETYAGSGQECAASNVTISIQASVGDLVFAVANGATAVLPSVTLDRFQQADGSISIDLSATTSSKVWALQVP